MKSRKKGPNAAGRGFDARRLRPGSVLPTAASALVHSALSHWVFCGVLLWIGAGSGFAQVNPDEILNPQLRAVERTYLRQLEALNRAIRSISFPFSFFLSRYVGLDPQKQVEADTRGLEFVNFHDRVVLKITGNYNAAYNADLLTQNQRASRAFQEVIVPILQLLPKEIPADVTSDAIGFEISYHVRRQNRSYGYEGKELFVVVFDKTDAFSYINSSRESDQQEILNRSEIYLNGNEYGLALGAREPISVDALERSVSHKPVPATEKEPESPPSRSDVRLSRIYQDPSPDLRRPGTQTTTGARPASSRSESTMHPETETQAAPVAPSTPADAERLMAKYQSQLDTLAKEGVAKLHFVDYASPSFVIFRDRIFLQLTLRNSLRFDSEKTSIYKRAAQSFDLFLAPQLKPLLVKAPSGAEFDGLDITILNQLDSKPKPFSEAIEFVFPLKALRQFADAEITNQDLINQSVVLLNGVRIALDLQQVE